MSSGDFGSLNSTDDIEQNLVSNTPEQISGEFKEEEHTTTTQIPKAPARALDDVVVEDLLTFKAETTSIPIHAQSVTNGGLEKLKLTSTGKGNAVEEVTTVSEKNEQSKAEDLGLKSPLAHWMILHNVNNSVLKLVYWKELQCSAGVFGGILFLLFSLKCYPLITVVSTFALSILAVAALYRIGMTIVNAVQKTSAEHPFKALLEENIELSEDAMNALAGSTRIFINKEIKCLQKLFLIKNFFQSVKFGLTLWLLSYIGCNFDFLTMVILCVVGLFTIPKFYEEKQIEIDRAFNITTTKLTNATNQIEAKLPERMKKFLAKDKKE